MKSNFFLSCCILLSFAVNGQIEFNPKVILLENDENTTDFEIRMTATNTCPETKALYWTFEEGVNFPEEWDVSLKDYNLCYPFNDYDCHIEIPNILISGDSIRFHVRVLSNNVTASTYGIINLYSDSLFTDLVASTSPPTNSIDNEVDVDFVIYPNPVGDNFRIANDSQVESIDVVGINGQLIKSSPHYPGKSHSAIEHRMEIWSLFYSLKRSKQS